MPPSSFRLLFLGLLLTSTAALTQVPATQVVITGLRSPKGTLILKFFKDQASYEAEKPFKKFEFAKQGLRNGSLTVSCPVEPGAYGIVLLDDENQNGTLDKNWVGLPKEGFGFSNYYLEGLHRPTLTDFRTEMKGGAPVPIRVKYM